jgi:excinuclease ABC subunit C
MSKLPDRLEELPASPGVYLFKDEAGKVIYVGKALNLRSRVRAYFNESDTRPQIRFLRPKIKAIDFMLTDTEKESLILENNLIKKYQPRYNIRLRDDKTFYHLKLTTSEKFPRLLLARRPDKSRDLVFGPFASSAAVHETMRLILKSFPLRRCTTRKFQTRQRPCINFEMGKCPGPCAGRISEQEYGKSVRQLARLLRGEGREMVSELEAEMKDASARLEFEKAASLRDQLRAIRETLEKQKVEVNAAVDRDVLGYHWQADRAMVFRLGYRQGILLIGHPFLIRQVQVPDREALAAFLKQFYLGRDCIPAEILLPFAVEDQELLRESLQDQAGRKVELSVPERGDKRGQVELASANARQALASSDEQERLKQDGLVQLQSILHLRTLPRVIEGFDISNLGGKVAVGSMVRFSGGGPDKSGYRRYQLKGVSGPDDFEMMRQLLSRRFQRALLEKQELPDLLVLDGGKGQLNIALKLLAELKLTELPVIALAKERETGAPLSSQLVKKPERVFVPGRKDPVLVKLEPARHLLTRVRDEAHRFALAYLQKLRRKAPYKSVLLQIPGIGEKKRRALLRHFSSLKRLREAGFEQLQEVPGLSSRDIEQVWKFLHASRR